MQPSAHIVNSLALLSAEPGQDAPAPKAGGPAGGPQRGVGAAWLMAGSAILGVGLGQAIDRYFGTTPTWTIALSMLFIGVGIYQTIREASR